MCDLAALPWVFYESCDWLQIVGKTKQNKITDAQEHYEKTTKKEKPVKGTKLTIKCFLPEN